MMTEDFNALLDALKIDFANVIGWSDGGINGLLLAINHPEKVKKLAITGANLTPDPSVLNPAAFAMISEYTANLQSAKQDAATKNTLKLFQMMLVEPNIPLTDLQKIKCPVLVMGGDNDAIKPATLCKFLKTYRKPISGYFRRRDTEPYSVTAMNSILK